MRLIAFTLIVLTLHSGHSLASEGLADAGLFICLPLQATEEWVRKCHSEFPEFSEANLSAFNLWKERNSTKFEESQSKCLVGLLETLPKEHQGDVSEKLKIGVTQRNNEVWGKLSRNQLKAYCKEMPSALKERERFLEEFLNPPHRAKGS